MIVEVTLFVDERAVIPTRPIELPNLGSAIVHRDNLDGLRVWATVTFDGPPPPEWEWETRVVDPIRDAIGVG